MPGVTTIEGLIESSNKLTLITAKKTVNSLYDYLHIKGLYLVAKLRPTDDPLSRAENIDFIVNFLDSTQLHLCPFWNKLDREMKIVAARYITLRDESDMTLTAVSRTAEAGVFILLSGRATLTSVNKEAPGKKAEKLRMGAVFGPTDVFNSERDTDEELVVTYKARVTAGSVLQLRYMDLQRAKYGDQRALATPLSGLSAQEVEVLGAVRLAEARLSPAVFQFLQRNNLLPASDKDASFRYIKHGNIGRRVPSRQQQSDVLLVLDGGLRVLLGEQGGQDVAGSVRCARVGERSATFQIQQFPLTILESGAILYLDEKTLSAPGGGGGSVKSSEPPPLVSMGTIAQLLQGQEDQESLLSGGGALDVLSLQQSGGGGQPVPLAAFTQHISLQFERPTTYLSIPLKKIRNSLQNETHRVNVDIRKELSAVCRSLSSRLEALRPLIGGSLIFRTSQHASPRSERDDLDFELCNGDIASADTDLAGAYGIRTKLDCQLHSIPPTSSEAHT